MKPRQFINLYHLGNDESIAQFGRYEEEAILCVQALNQSILKKVLQPADLIKNEGTTIEDALLKSNFYYLTGFNNKEFVHYIDCGHPKSVNWADKPQFEERILQEDPWRGPTQKIKRNRGGRNNSKNRKK